jgi:subtilisin family serine protease
MRLNLNQTKLTPFIWILSFLLIILSSPPVFGFSCKEKSLNFDSATILLEIKNNKSYLKSLKDINFYLQKKFPNIEFILEPLLENSKDRKLSQSLGLEKIYKLNILNSSNDKTECENIKRVFQALKKNNYFREVSLDYEMEINSLNDFFYNTNGTYWSLKPLDEMFAIKNYGLEEIWQTTTGSGIVVAVIDTGVDYNHPDLWKNIWVNPKKASDVNKDGRVDLDDIDINSNKKIEFNELKQDLIGNNFVNNNKDPQDKKNGHGTHIAGVIAAKANNSIGITGIAPEAKIMVIKALNDSGKAKFSNIAKAIIYASDQKADIINSSWGCNCKLPLMLRKAYRYADKKGVLIVSAGGNNASSRNNYSPANLQQVISVASVNHENQLSSFSNFGTSIDIAAPGQNILSTLAQGTLIYKNPSTKMNADDSFDYYYQSGTSTSSAYISGICALILSKNPGLRVQEVKNQLKNSTDPLKGYGFGRINPLKLFD